MTNPMPDAKRALADAVTPAMLAHELRKRGQYGVLLAGRASLTNDMEFEHKMDEATCAMILPALRSAFVNALNALEAPHA